MYAVRAQLATFALDLLISRISAFVRRYYVTKADKVLVTRDIKDEERVRGVGVAMPCYCSISPCEDTCPFAPSSWEFSWRRQKDSL